MGKVTRLGRYKPASRPIKQVTFEEIRDVIRRCIDPEVDPEALREYLDSVDWTKANTSGDIEWTLSGVEGFVDEHQEGDMTLAELKEELAQFL